jgi:hypothetical protein
MDKGEPLDTMPDSAIAWCLIHRKRVSNMTDACPISDQQMNEKIAQVNATLTVLTILVFLVTQSILVIAVLAVDFYIRGFHNPANSYYSKFSKKILSSFQIAPHMVNAGPKIFAAKVGFIFCCLIAVTHLLGLSVTCTIFALMIAFCATLEAIFRICIACKIYFLIYKS